MTIHAYLGLVRQAVTAANADLPKPVADALAARDALTATADRLPTGSHAEMMGAVADALVAGRDPLDDEQVRRLVVARILGGETGGSLAYGIGNAADERIVAALAENVDAICDSFKAGVDAAGQVLAEAHDLFGDVDLDESHLILKMGPKASGAWTDAKDAVQRIRVIDSGWFALAELVHFAGTTTSRAVRLADVTLEQSEQLGHRAEPWAIVRAGATINMAATADAIAERVQRIAVEREQREQRADAGFGNEFRRTQGTGAVV
jgi:hypothetical protein